jgi:O-acetyl-ADP-ribose deacetylase (regulator of RNase III)
MELEIVRGDILNQKVEVIVNSWNRNIFPWWLLIPQGVSGAIKRKAGIVPFQELRKKGILDLGEAVLTSSGNLNYKGIIHVAGINFLWTATEKSILSSTHNAIKLAEEKSFRSIALPLIGAGSGRYKPDKVLKIMIEEIKQHKSKMRVIIVVKEGITLDLNNK